MKKKKDRKSQEGAIALFMGIVFYGLWHFLDVNFFLSVIASAAAGIFAEVLTGTRIKDLFKRREEK